MEFERFGAEARALTDEVLLEGILKPELACFVKLQFNVFRGREMRLIHLYEFAPTIASKMTYTIATGKLLAVDGLLEVFKALNDVFVHHKDLIEKLLKFLRSEPKDRRLSWNLQEIGRICDAYFAAALRIVELCPFADLSRNSVLWWTAPA
jgi:hypothetical protein